MSDGTLWALENYSSNGTQMQVYTIDSNSPLVTTVRR